jgi:hypothetical protein
MISILIFALVLGAAGGFIAWFGDRLGTWVGKKRISAIGLRPRQTAALYTIFTGVLIAVSVFALLVSADQKYRIAVLRGPQLIREVNRLTRQQTDEQKRLRAMQDQDSAAVQAETTAQQERNEAQRQTADAEGELASTRAKLSLSKNILLATQHQLGSVRANLSQTRAQLVAAQTSVRTTNAGLVHAQAMLARVQGDVKRLQHIEVAIGRSLGQARVSPLIYKPQEEVGRTVIPTSLAASDVAGRLWDFLGRLDETADETGGANGVLFVPGNAGSATSESLAAQQRDAIDALSQNISAESRKASSVVVVARAAVNTFRGERTEVELAPYDNLLIYPKNSVVASRTIDGTQSDIEILADLKDFLTGQVRSAAISQGLIPRYDPKTGEPFVDPGMKIDLHPLLRQILRISGPAQVTARAVQDTYTSGPLHISLSATAVTPAPPRTAKPVSSGTAAFSVSR